MQKLTVEDAVEILESGELYRVGWNLFNQGEMFFVFGGVQQSEYDLGQASVYEHLLSIGTITEGPKSSLITNQIENLRKLWLFGWQGFSAQEAIDGVGYDRPQGKLGYQNEGNFCSGSGAEPMWILEDGETCYDIPIGYETEDGFKFYFNADGELTDGDLTFNSVSELFAVHDARPITMELNDLDSKRKAHCLENQ
tara:strand:+ start:270 stop:857 length:588 start_codon:yes stop_codon:yes gene_type:complete